MRLSAPTAVVKGLPICARLHSRPLPCRGLLRDLRALTASSSAASHWTRLAQGSLHARRNSCFISASSVTQTASVFPAGRKQVRVKLPACILKVAAADVLQQEQFADVLSSVTAGGITGVLLTDASGTDGAALYEAACKLKEQLRARAVLLISDRTDIVDAAEADGVVLSSKGNGWRVYAACTVVRAARSLFHRTHS